MDDCNPQSTHFVLLENPQLPQAVAFPQASADFLRQRAAGVFHLSSAEWRSYFSLHAVILFLVTSIRVVPRYNAGQGFTPHLKLALR